MAWRRSLCIQLCGPFSALGLTMGVAAIGCASSNTSGNDPGGGSYIPTIDGEWSRGDESLVLSGPGYYVNSGAVSVIVNGADGGSNDAQGQLSGRKITFSLSESHTINLLNDSQIDLDGAKPPYEKVYLPDLNTDVWCELGGSGGKFILNYAQSDAPDVCPAGVSAQSFQGNKVAESGVSPVAGIVCPSNPPTGVYVASVRQFESPVGSAIKWNGNFLGVSRIELSSGNDKLTLERRPSDKGCD